MENEYRVYGPPGTGKTHWLVGQIKRAVEARGPDDILIASFTKAAAAEIANRANTAENSKVGTLHAICYRSLGRPTLAETKIPEWNDWIVSEGWAPLQLTNKMSADMDDPEANTDGDTNGDGLFMKIQRNRARLLTKELWNPNEVEFYDLWREWKLENDYMDFTDLIESANNGLVTPPGNPSIGFFDEAQDFTALDFSVVRRWSENMETAILVGDDDQCIYSWLGASPDSFLDKSIDQDHKKYLTQSYRVPVAVHEYAMEWIERIDNREPKEYKPRDFQGKVERKQQYIYKVPEDFLPEMQERIDDGKSVMMLTACGFMLSQMKKYLRAKGIPFHNPYAKKKGDWNPLARGASKRRMPVDRALAFYRPNQEMVGSQNARMWTWAELWMWIELMDSKKMLKHGMKAKFKEKAVMDSDATADVKLFPYWFKEEAWLSFDITPQWFDDNILASKHKTYQFIHKIIENYSPQKLFEKPKLIIGTIHSVKGGEADIVYVFPDLSLPGATQWVSSNRDDILRQFYVAFTRAREELILCGNSSSYTVEF